MLERLKEIVKYPKNLKAEREARIKAYYESERDPEGIDFASFDPYTDGLVKTIYESRFDKPNKKE